jgi:hypothetical protein
MNDTKPFGVRLEAKTTLPATLDTVITKLSVPYCDISGFGELEWVSIISEDEGNPQCFKGPLQLLQLKGRVRRAGSVALSDFVCIVSRQTDNGIQVLGGKLLEAVASFLELTFTPLSEANDTMMGDLPSAPNDPKTRDAKPREVVQNAAPISARARSPENALESRWASAVEEAKRIQEDPGFSRDSEPDLKPARGDFVNHMQFGECKVTRIDDDHITLRKPDGRNVQLGLQILSFSYDGERGGKSVFHVKVSKR